MNLSLNTRIIHQASAFVLAAVLTVGMLGGINQLATAGNSNDTLAHSASTAVVAAKAAGTTLN